MTCHQFEPYIVDLARARVNPNAEVGRHLRVCDACAALFERERALSGGLRRLAAEFDTPADHEPALLAAFDARWARLQPPSQMPLTAGLAAAGMVLAAALTWQLGTRSAPALVPPPSRPDVVLPQARAEIASASSMDLPAAPSAPAVDRAPVRRQSAAAPDAGEFVAWPGAAAWPPFESGALIRVELAFDGGSVEADILVGQDGFARAVRLVQ